MIFVFVFGFVFDGLAIQFVLRILVLASLVGSICCFTYCLHLVVDLVLTLLLFWAFLG